MRRKGAGAEHQKRQVSESQDSERQISASGAAAAEAAITNRENARQSFEQRGRSLPKLGRSESTTDAIDPGIDGLAVLSAARIAWPEKRLQDQRDGARI